MRLVLASFIVVVFASCGHTAPPSDETKTVVNQPQAEPVPVVVRFTPAQATQAEGAEVERFAKESHAALRTVLGLTDHPSRQIVIRLEGDAGQGAFPTVDPESGDIRLFRFPGDAGYTGSLAHEMVHALRFELWTDKARQTNAFLFVEEGFAETAAVQIGHPSVGFPTFGFPVSIAAGAWLGDDPARTLLALVQEHQTLNFRCMAQAYTLRLSFMNFLVERYGFERLVELAQTVSPLEPTSIGRHYGTTLPELATEWSAWATQRLAQTTDSKTSVANYLASPISYLPQCEQDVFQSIVISSDG